MRELQDWAAERECVRERWGGGGGLTGEDVIAKDLIAKDVIATQDSCVAQADKLRAPRLAARWKGFGVHFTHRIFKKKYFCFLVLSHLPPPTAKFVSSVCPRGHELCSAGLR